MKQPDKNVCVVLGGGGAKGFVHVGVLEALIEMEYNINCIVGTSIGAMIGAMFAYERSISFGHLSRNDAQVNSIKAVKDFWMNIDLSEYTSSNIIALFRKGFYKKTDQLDKLINDQFLSTDHNDTNSIRFADLDFPLTLTAVDLQTGKQLILNRHECPATLVGNAVRASISLPGAFKEVELEICGRRYKCWDGGIAGNCRIDIAQKLHSDNLIVASTLTYRGEPVFESFPLLKLKYILDQVISCAMKNIDDRINELVSSSANDIIIVKPDLNGVSTYDFHITADQRSTLFKNGNLATRKSIEL